ncbi:MAG: elongation factor P [Thermaerobacter sp.]|nr:elongation factor P [Thermaerobacter sp.]
MISSNDFRNGVTIEYDGQVWQVLEFQHVKPGKGSAFVRTKMKNLLTGSIVERTFNAGERVAAAKVERREMQYLYESSGEYTFMDTESFEQIGLSADQVGDGVKYLKENMTCYIVLYREAPISVELPNSVELAVTETDPGLRGDTASGGNKPATTETGAVVKVPLFIETGDRIMVDTRTGQYLGRA